MYDEAVLVDEERAFQVRAAATETLDQFTGCGSSCCRHGYDPGRRRRRDSTLVNVIGYCRKLHTSIIMFGSVSTGNDNKL